MNSHQIIIKPLDTEKTRTQKEVSNQITFEVAPKSNRIEIRKAVEQLFKVRVMSVSTMRVKGKKKRRGRIIGQRKNWKKAIVRLMPGERIEFFEGV